MNTSHHTVVAITIMIATILVDALWLPYSNISLDQQELRRFVIAEVTVISLFGVVSLVVNRLKNESGRVGRALYCSANVTKGVLLFFLVMVPLSAGAGIFSYLATGLNRPLLDETLASLDAVVGFHWVALLAAVNSMSAIVRPLEFAYHSLIPQLFVLPILLAITGRPERMMELAAVLSVVVAMTVLTMAAVPSIGPFGYFMPPPEAYSAIEHFAGNVHIQHFHALRSEEPFVITRGTGLVSFPSLHTALALLITFAMRGFRFLFAPVALLNAVMIVSTVPIGGHYLVDVIAGTIIAAASIYLVRYRAVTALPAISAASGRGLP